MKQHLMVFLALGLFAFSSRAQQPASPPAAADAPKIAVAGADDEAYAGLVKGELELNAQINLLGDLAQEHRKRAEDATKGNQTDRAVWESEWAKELHDKSSAMLKQLNEVAKQRQVFEQTHKSAAVSASSLSTATAATRFSGREIEFLSRIDERLAQVEQELVSTRQYGTVYALQMQTNTAPYDLEKTTALLEDNARKVRQLEQEQFDLKLRRLEFEALRRH
jgi:hypothetical protein